MLKYLSIILMLLTSCANAQQTSWSTEFQSSFIDISGLFGLEEPAQITTLRYLHKGFYVEGFHSFSWEEPGMTIQTFFTGGYQFYFNKRQNTSLALGNGFAFNRVAANGSFLRPVVTFIWNPSESHSFSWLGWMFVDTRKETANPLNGATTYAAYIYKRASAKYAIRNELRLLYAHVQHVRNTTGITDQIKVSLKPSLVYFFVNTGYSFYRSDSKTAFLYNFGLGKQF